MPRLEQGRCHGCQQPIFEGTQFKIVREFVYHLACVGTVPALTREESRLAVELAQARETIATLNARITATAVEYRSSLETKKGSQREIRELRKQLKEMQERTDAEVTRLRAELKTRATAAEALGRNITDLQTRLAKYEGAPVPDVTPTPEDATAARGRALELD
jgi:predicted RNase H-like nuclease (RuvC/YqgF family)